VSDLMEMLQALRAKARDRNPTDALAPKTFAEKAADWVAATVGSWAFIGIQSALLIGWIIFNATSAERVDPYPFILLNLLLSFQAAYTAPIIMMSQNRLSDVDRRRSIDDFEINQKAELEIELLHRKIDLLREKELADLAAAVARLSALLEEKRAG